MVGRGRALVGVVVVGRRVVALVGDDRRRGRVVALSSRACVVVVA
ncbi:hypothetical protein ACXZ9C_11065 [Streptococcus agalactiae]